MKAVTKELLETMLEALQAHPELEPWISELVDPKMGTVSGFQDIIDSIGELKKLDLSGFDPL